MSRTHEERVRAVCRHMNDEIDGLTMMNVLDAYHAALEADGWQVTRVEPTDHQINVGRQTRSQTLGSSADSIYRAMLAAAPSPLDHQPHQQDSPDQDEGRSVPVKAGDTHDG